MKPSSNSREPRLRKRLLYFVSEDWYFCSHRLPLAVAAKARGFDVTVVTRVHSHGAVIREHGLNLIPIDLDRRSFNPWREFATIAALTRAYRGVRPDIVHHVALKPVLYGSLAAILSRTPAVVNALAGLGYLFSSSQWKARLLRPAVTAVFRLLLKRGGPWVILQNPDDRDTLLQNGALLPERCVLIRGSGVDTEAFCASQEPSGRPIVVLASRMLWDKGIAEFVAAARMLREQGVDARFVLVGERDPANPAAIPEPVLLEWQSSGAVEWRGHREDMPHVFAESSIVCLPSYREGLPKVLLEAAASGRPLVGTDVPGVREIVRHNQNGLLVPPRDSPALAGALRQLIENRELRLSMGRRGREIVVDEFSIERVIAASMRLYEEALARA